MLLKRATPPRTPAGYKLSVGITVPLAFYARLERVRRRQSLSRARMCYLALVDYVAKHEADDS